MPEELPRNKSTAKRFAVDVEDLEFTPEQSEDVLGAEEDQ